MNKLIYIVTEIVPNLRSTNINEENFDFVEIFSDSYCDVTIIGIYFDEKEAKSKVSIHPYRKLHIQNIDI